MGRRMGYQGLVRHDANHMTVDGDHPNNAAEPLPFLLPQFTIILVTVLCAVTSS